MIPQRLAPDTHATLIIIMYIIHHGYVIFTPKLVNGL